MAVACTPANLHSLGSVDKKAILDFPAPVAAQDPHPQAVVPSPCQSIDGRSHHSIDPAVWRSGRHTRREHKYVVPTVESVR
eukprot:4040186-Pyramimonas_sp.AAC.1